MTLAQLKTYFRTLLKVVTGGPAVGTAGANRTAGVLKALDALADFAASNTGTTYTDAQARAALLGLVAAPGTTLITLTSESRTQYGQLNSGHFTIDPAGCVADKHVTFTVGAGAGPPVFYTDPAGRPYRFRGQYFAGYAWDYSVLVCATDIQVLILPQPAAYLGVHRPLVPTGGFPYVLPAKLP